MSGTSVDGIDACLADISGHGMDTKVSVLAFDTYPYDTATRTAILDACNPATGSVDKICPLNFYLGKLFAEAAKSIAARAGVAIADVDLVGSHGQTIYHLPNPQPSTSPGGTRSTLQIGEPSVIAQETGVMTVADFRPRDMAAGGQGAPLVPYADFILFRSREKGRALQNIGGIANVTFMPKGCAIEDIVAFDTGPGNMIIDRVAERITSHQYTFDKDGDMAAGGTVCDGLLKELIKHPYLSKQPPKTTGREEFGRVFADNLYEDAVRSGIKGVDVLATVTAFTAYTIADSYNKWILPSRQLSEVILSGGGCHNRTLVKFLAHYLNPSIAVHSLEAFGIAPNVRESLAFAILAYETVNGNCNNVPGATGAREAVVMGKIVPGRR